MLTNLIRTQSLRENNCARVNDTAEGGFAREINHLLSGGEREGGELWATSLVDLFDCTLPKADCKLILTFFLQSVYGRRHHLAARIILQASSDFCLENECKSHYDVEKARAWNGDVRSTIFLTWLRTAPIATIHLLYL